jgi:sugar phosphate isomerase/epimerase
LATPKISISCPTTYTATIFEDIRNYSAAGATGIGLWEYKIADGDDGKVKDAMDAAGLAATLCCPTVPSLIKDLGFPEPADPDERLAALTTSIRRFAPFNPAGILVTTGDPADYGGVAEGKRLVIERLKPAADVAGELGITLGIEPYRQTSGTLVTTMPEVLELVDAVGRPNVKVIIDVWHYWDVPDGLTALAENVGRLVGIQLNDWREPTRSWCDRLLPGDGIIDIRAFFRALTGAGYDGWYDVEVFSDNGLFGNNYPDSVWARPADEISRDSVSKVLQLWNTMDQGA